MAMSKSKKAPKTRLKLVLKTGDTVQVITGKDKGRTGKIQYIDRVKARVVVEGVNIVTKHIKPKGADQPGRIDKQEAPIHYSNVLLYNEQSKQGERVRIQVNDDGSKTRIFAKSGNKAD